MGLREHVLSPATTLDWRRERLEQRSLRWRPFSGRVPPTRRSDGPISMYRRATGVADAQKLSSCSRSVSKSLLASSGTLDAVDAAATVGGNVLLICERTPHSTSLGGRLCKHA